MPYTENLDLFILEERIRIRSYFSTNRTKLIEFINSNNFRDWYFNQLEMQNNCCHYCKTNILEIRSLINNNIIQGRHVRGNGLRGPNFELDRKNPFLGYNQENCVVCCYFCNNDKSNTFSYEIYRDIIGPAKGKSFRTLLNL